MKDLQAKDLKEAICGAANGSGIALQHEIAKEVRKEEKIVKKILGNICKLFGCYAKKHTRTTSKLCKYHTCHSSEDVFSRWMHSFGRSIQKVTLLILVGGYSISWSRTRIVGVPGTPKRYCLSPPVIFNCKMGKR